MVTEIMLNENFGRNLTRIKKLEVDADHQILGILTESAVTETSQLKVMKAK